MSAPDPLDLLREFRDLAASLGGYSYAIDVLDMFGADPDLVELATNHIVTNGAGRIEGAVWRLREDTPRPWVADVDCGPNYGKQRQFATEFGARAFVNGVDPDRIDLLESERSPRLPPPLLRPPVRDARP